MPGVKSFIFNGGCQYLSHVEQWRGRKTGGNLMAVEVLFGRVKIE